MSAQESDGKSSDRVNEEAPSSVQGARQFLNDQESNGAQSGKSTEGGAKDETAAPKKKSGGCVLL